MNAPILTMYRFGIYFTAFLIGYYIFSHDKIQNIIEKIHIPMLIIAIIGAITYAVHYYGNDYTTPMCLQSIFTNLYLWIAVLAAVGCTKKYFNKETAFTRYMSKNSFGLYILHYPVLIVTCYILHYHSNLSVIWKYLLAFIIEFVVILLLNEIVKRIPVIRFIILGQNVHR